MSGTPLVLGVDSSTQSTKVEARELASGRVVAVGRAAHPPTTPPVSEQDPESWWRALVDAVEQLGDRRNDVVAISVAGQQHGLVLLDETGRSVRPAKLWNDTTSAEQADRLVRAIGAERWARECGSVPVASFTITKLAWVAEHEPDALGRTAMVMLPHDYLTWRLCGAHVTDRGDASGSGWFDPTTNAVRPELVELAVGGAAFAAELPRVLGPSEAAGVLTSAAAGELGLPAGVVVGPGTGDNMGAALGLGLQPGDVAVSLGTSGTVFAVTATGACDASGAVAGFADATGAFLPLVCTLNATKVTDTVARWLGTNAEGLAALALDAPVGSQTAVLVPYFDGERTPNRPDAMGLFSGLTNVTTREELARAAHDGVLCGLLDGVDAIAAVTGSGGRAEPGGRLLLVGGGARSAAYRQRLADLAERDVVVPDADEAVASGAALQAASVAGAEWSGAVSARWGLGSGSSTAPRRGVHAAAVRAQYRAAVQS
jgi:xylulokinase